MNRVYHTWDEWECYPAGMYETKPARPVYENVSDDELRDVYADFLKDRPRFRLAASRVIREWPNSSEHYLTNERMNRIAWIGQAAACIELGLPRAYRGGFNRLTEREQELANHVALDILNEWLEREGQKPLELEEAASKTEMDLY